MEIEEVLVLVVKVVVTIIGTALTGIIYANTDKPVNLFDLCVMILQATLVLVMIGVITLLWFIPFSIIY